MYFPTTEISLSLADNSEENNNPCRYKYSRVSNSLPHIAPNRPYMHGLNVSIIPLSFKEHILKSSSSHTFRKKCLRRYDFFGIHIVALLSLVFVLDFEVSETISLVSQINTDAPWSEIYLAHQFCLFKALSPDFSLPRARLLSRFNDRRESRPNGSGRWFR